jgi:hypothetical protein
VTVSADAYVAVDAGGRESMSRRAIVLDDASQPCRMVVGELGGRQ